MDQHETLLDFPEEQSNDIPLISLNEIARRIWLEATAMFRVLLRHYPGETVFTFFALSGMVQAYSRLDPEMVASKSLVSLLAYIILGGAISGVIFMPIYAWSLHVVGGWLEGKASNIECRTVLAWAQIPVLVRIPLLLLGILVFGKRFLNAEPLWAMNSDSLIYLGFALLEFTLAIWTLVLFVRGMMVAQNFSAGRAIANIFLGALLLILPIALLVGAFVFLTS